MEPGYLTVHDSLGTRVVMYSEESWPEYQGSHVQPGIMDRGSAESCTVRNPALGSRVVMYSEVPCSQC